MAPLPDATVFAAIPFQLVSGVAAEDENCLAADGHGAVTLEPCVRAIAHADDREIWTLDGSAP